MCLFHLHMRSHAEATHILRNQYYVPIVPLRKWRPSTVQDSPLVAQIELSCKSSSYSLAICHAPELQMNFKAAHGMHGGGGPWRQWTHTSQGSAKDEKHCSPFPIILQRVMPGLGRQRSTSERFARRYTLLL